MTPALMIQGAGSNVGKSMLVAGLCRAARHRGVSVAPFKPQNMSNNAAVTPDGGEIGRAQALQAMACCRPPSVHMNPVLLKPETDTGSQVVLRGQRIATVRAAEYQAMKPRLLGAVVESFETLARDADLVIVEGAGSPAEVNLRHGDIANMGFARAANIPVVLVGDIDRGGVIAQIVGTKAVIDPADAAMIAGFLVNKMRGDPQLFDDGYRFIADRTGWRGFGVVPWFADASRLPAEDAVDLGSRPAGGDLRIVCPVLSRIANFDDLDPLRLTQGVSVEMVTPGRPLPAGADLVILPGTKSTIGDLAFLRAQGWDIDLRAHVRQGGHVLGICGGFQMLGRTIADSAGLDGTPGEIDGLGLLDMATTMEPAKRLARVHGRHRATDTEVAGYEIHLGRSRGADLARPLFEIDGRAEGAISADGRVAGTYLHGMFTQDAFRAAYLAELGLAGRTDLAYGALAEATLDALADHLAAHLDLDALFAVARSRGG